MTHFRFPIANCRLATRVIVACMTLLSVALSATEVLARVGGGGSYGGGGGHGGGGGGGGIGALVYLLIRFLLWLTIEHPVIGIPVDIIVVILIILWFSRSAKRTISASSSPVLGLGLQAGPGRAPQPSVQQAFNQLRRFDPNFSEIIFTDFCYALYGRAHEARGKGKTALDELSPHLSEAARASLWQFNA